MIQTLNTIPFHQEHHAFRLSVPGILGDQLLELGFTPGASVTLLRRAPFGGPLQVRIRDFVIMLRKDEAQRIEVRAV